MTAQEVEDKLEAIHAFSEQHSSPWRNQVARDLNQLLARAEYCMTTCGDASDKTFAEAVLRIVERVAETEKIERDKHV